MCSGNHFRIVVRHPRDVTVVGGAVKAVRERGFVNYFGLQRFGKRGIRSDRVGLACLRCRETPETAARIAPELLQT